MQHGHRPIVAVVDDDQAVRDSLRFLLETAGFDVDTFDSACEFLAASVRDEPRYLLIDQHMPRLTGLDLLRRMRDRGMTGPVALMTGSPSPELSRRAHELGATIVLEKPLAEETLLRFLGHRG
jgi:two-component system response regulator FixJ